MISLTVKSKTKEKQKQTRNSNSRIQRTDRWLPEEGVLVGDMGEGGQKTLTSSYTINKSWGCNVQYGNYS